MDIVAHLQEHEFDPPLEPSCCRGERWYAAYTCANHEKAVARQLNVRSIETFLPLYERVSRWKDRRVRVQSALFPGYVFVRIPLREKMRVLEIPSVARLVGFNGQPTPLSEEDMNVLRHGLQTGLRAEPCPYLSLGRRIRVRSGPLQGLEGILKRKKTAFRFVISMELIQRSIAVEVDASDLDLLPLVSNNQASNQLSQVSALARNEGRQFVQA